MKKSTMIRSVMALFIFASAVSCAPAATLAPTAVPTISPTAMATSTPAVLPTATQGAASSTVTASAGTTSDPFAYCAAVGTIDAPDARYTGPKVPQAIAEGIKKASNAAPDAPLDFFTNNSFWRCMDGKVYGCTVGANLPCTTKADTSRTPTADEVDFCKANPKADVIPAVVTGRATVYEWRCTNGAPEIVRQIVTPDARGFQSNIWYLLNP